MSLTINTIGGGGKGLQPQIHVTAPTGSTVTATNGDRVITAQEKIVVTPMEARLPEEYQEVEYIQSSGTQYIDTLITGGTNASFEMTARMVETNAKNNNQFFGTISNFCSVNGTSSYFRIEPSGGGAYAVNFTTDPTTKWNIRVNSDGSIYCNDELQGTISSIAGKGWDGNTYANQIFITADDGINYATSAELYALKMYTDGNLVRDFVPCYIKATSEAGLYDLVTETFFGNDGTGAFTVGADVVYEDIIEYLGWDFVLPCLGTWTVTGELDGMTKSKDIIINTVKIYNFELSYIPGYITDGMILWLDGEYNNGLDDTHQTEIASWVDCSGNEFYGTLNNCTVSDKCVSTQGSTSSYISIPSSDELSSEIRTIELVISLNGYSGSYATFMQKTSGYAYTQNQIQFEYPNTYVRFHIANGSSTSDNDDTAPITNQPVYYSTTADGSNYILYRNGELYLSNATSVVPGNTSNNMILGYNSNYSSWTKCDYYCVRIYNRALSAEEVAHNYEIDKKRFALIS